MTVLLKVSVGVVVVVVVVVAVIISGVIKYIIIILTTTITTTTTIEIVSDLKPLYEMPNEAIEWIDHMIRYTVDGGKMNRGLALVQVVNEFCKSEANKSKLTLDNMRFFFKNYLTSVKRAFDTKVFDRGNTKHKQQSQNSNTILRPAIKPPQN